MLFYSLSVGYPMYAVALRDSSLYCCKAVCLVHLETMELPSDRLRYAYAWAFKQFSGMFH